ncbi:PHA/PHB synthase family protein [Alkalilimnicola sp. S0819]|uniref:PHA/PHB synthase family protein n=1 Tax=Alkalilimnicola sp. S0819 TaxID=2613922 RepID=UPI0012614E62|nr:alpha/beta fold hydrolase [Alkalilimnicola sp. S0819]KAB7622979.1 alpha/beta fold hydrolase [Alkalilimnicola sp. S0819]MPQ17088.1 alpha/beta fold hydrolase [Alkalilimnicola sp. S0819]
MFRSLLGSHDSAEVHPLDRALHGGLGRFTRGLSPVALYMAWLDWAVHLASYPGKQCDLVERAMGKHARFAVYAMSHRACGPDHCVKPKAGDHRFDAPEWQHWPFNLVHQGFLLSQEWWESATTNVRGVQSHNEAVVHFVGRQMLDVLSPSNYLFTNPEVLRRTFEERGMNLLRGWRNFLEDQEYRYSGEGVPGRENFPVGEVLAATPGKVVYRNQLMELIQYRPATDKVHPEPVLIVPAWIMKYYILDLRPGKSLIEYLVAQGHTVFAISWKNPGPEERDFGMDDYRRLGVMAALDAVGAIVPERKVHALGYCLGGTLLSIAAAAMARDGDERLKTMTLLAAQIDFREPGELDLFIDESQLAFLEDTMWRQGYLGTDQMAGAFRLLRSQDLIWSRMVRNYLMGEREKLFDLMAWNADATRLPYRMHSEYLHRLFLHNDLVEGRYDVDGEPIHFGDIQVPIFAVGTVSDHVAPWASTYKVNRFARTEVTYLLTSGGHNAGIVTRPGHPRRQYQCHTRHPREPFIHHDQFRREMERHRGSWWPAWQGWLAKRSGQPVKHPAMGAPDAGYRPLADAPGEYVLEQ